MDEVWKNTIGGYMVSNMGRIKNPKRYDRSGHLREERIMHPFVSPHGYKRINLYICGKRKNFFVHRLVALEFVEGFEEGLTVNHIDGNKLNNSYQNLEWVTSGENQKHAYKTGLKKARVNDEEKSKRVRQYSKSGEFIKEYPSSKEVERQTGFDRSHVCKVCRKEYRSAYGYLWEFA